MIERFRTAAPYLRASPVTRVSCVLPTEARARLRPAVSSRSPCCRAAGAHMEAPPGGGGGGGGEEPNERPRGKEAAANAGAATQTVSVFGNGDLGTQLFMLILLMLGMYKVRGRGLSPWSRERRGERTASQQRARLLSARPPARPGACPGPALTDVALRRRPLRGALASGAWWSTVLSAMDRPF